MDKSVIILIVDALVYILTLGYWWRKRGLMNAGVFILSIMTLSHITAFFNYTLLRNIGMMYYDIQIVPFIFLYLMIMICIYPFLSYKGIIEINVTRIKGLIRYLTVFVTIVSIEPLFENIYLFLTQTNDYSSLYDSMREGDLKIFSPLGYTFMGWANHLRTFIPIAFFYYLSQERKKSLFILGLLLCMLNQVLFWVNIGGRGGIISQFFIYFVSFILLRPLFSAELLKKTKKIALILAIPFLVIFILISQSRFDSHSQISYTQSRLGFSSIFLMYLSEGPVKFNTEMWDAKHNTNGDVNCNYFKSLLGMKTYVTYEERDEHYIAKNGRRIEVFYTYVGDFVSDFGIGGCFIICILLSILARSLLCTQHMPFQNFLILVLLLHIYSIGFASNIYRAFGMQKNALYTIVIFIILSLCFKPLKSGKYDFNSYGNV